MQCSAMHPRPSSSRNDSCTPGCTRNFVTFPRLAVSIRSPWIRPSVYPRLLIPRGVNYRVVHVPYPRVYLRNTRLFLPDASCMRAHKYRGSSLSLSYMRACVRSPVHVCHAHVHATSLALSLSFSLTVQLSVIYAKASCAFFSVSGSHTPSVHM